MIHVYEMLTAYS